MNTATAQNDLVPLSQPLGRGTLGQSPNRGTVRGTSNGTTSLKCLANRVLQRSKAGQPVGQAMGQGQQSCPTGGDGLGQTNCVVPFIAPADFSTGLEWIVWPVDDADPDFDARWAAVDLRDLGKLHGVRVVHSGERTFAVYPPSLEPELIAHAGSLLVEARDYLSAHMDKLPALNPAEAVEIVKSIMRQHRGLGFCRGDGGSRWPLYPKTWTAGQKATVQALWFAAGPALDRDDFKGIDAG